MTMFLSFSRNNISPPLLIYNSFNIKIATTKFFNNHPGELGLNITSNPCFFPQIENISSFLDNRTTSGGVSLYKDDRVPLKLLIENCSFVSNSARNDTQVTLVRRSERNGHGGAVNLRLLDSFNGTVCIRNTTFLDNLAEAHAGALAISIGGSAASNKFIVSRSVFEDNRCLIDKCTGGAVGIGFFSGTRFNTLTFQDCNFTGNQARSSGAMVLFTSASAEYSPDGVSDGVTLRNCQFVRNKAFFEGTALGAFSISNTNLIGLPVDIHDW